MCPQVIPAEPWFYSLVCLELAFQLPFFFVGAVGFALGQKWIQKPAIVRPLSSGVCAPRLTHCCDSRTHWIDLCVGSSRRWQGILGWACACMRVCVFVRACTRARVSLCVCTCVWMCGKKRRNVNTGAGAFAKASPARRVERQQGLLEQRE